MFSPFLSCSLVFGKTLPCIPRRANSAASIHKELYVSFEHWEWSIAITMVIGSRVRVKRVYSKTPVGVLESKDTMNVKCQHRPDAATSKA